MCYTDNVNDRGNAKRGISNEISKTLFKAFGEERLVSVQLSVLNLVGERSKSFAGHVLGVDENKAIIGQHIVDLAEINHVDIIK